MRDEAERETNRDLIDEWIDRNGPDGISKLAMKSEVSSHTISKTRHTCKAPKKRSTRLKLCKALGVSEDALFPPVSGRRGKAAS